MFLPTYRGLIRNGSSGFSTKKVEFPASLLKREGIFFRPMLFWLEDVKKSSSLPQSFGYSTKKGRMQLKTSAKR
jgi:hypothetical protein